MSETPADAMVRKAQERQQAAEAAERAAAAEKKADDLAKSDPKVAESKQRQEEEEAKADLQARQQAAQEMLSQNAGTNIPGVPAVTANASGNPTPATRVPAPQTATIELAPVLVKDEVGLIERPWRTFQHLYANANTIMPDGKKIIFGGQNGHTGQYSTNNEEQIKHLSTLANTPGSMITEVRQDSEGRYIVVTDAILEAEKQAALIDSRKNTAHQQDPNVAQAMNNLGRSIAQDS